MTFREVTENKKQYMTMLLDADPQENMIDRYLDRGRMFVLDDDGVKAECVVTEESPEILEIKNLAVEDSAKGKGYGRRMIEYIADTFRSQYPILQVGTGDSPATVPFYEKCGFVRSHIEKDFFTDNYDPPIIDAGVLLTDMVFFRMPLQDR